MFSLAIKWQMRSDNPCRGVERNDEHKRRRYLSADELMRLAGALAKLRDQQSADIIRLLLLTGARRGEILQARWADIDLEARTWTKPAATTKQRLDHSVPLGAAAIKLLTGIQEARKTGTEWVFPGDDAGPRRDIKEAWATACAKAGIQGARVHDLRHTFASVLISSGLSLPIVGALLGHSTPATTARYAHLLQDPLRAAIERAGALVTGQPAAEVTPLPTGRRRGRH
jgi:integrase